MRKILNVIEFLRQMMCIARDYITLNIFLDKLTTIKGVLYTGKSSMHLNEFTPWWNGMLIGGAGMDINFPLWTTDGLLLRVCDEQLFLSYM